VKDKKFEGCDEDGLVIVIKVEVARWALMFLAIVCIFT